MSQRLSTKTLLAKNPHIDAGKLRAGRALTKALRAAGLRRATYRLASPTDRHKVHVIGSRGQRCTVNLQGG